MRKEIGDNLKKTVEFMLLMALVSSGNASHGDSSPMRTRAEMETALEIERKVHAKGAEAINDSAFYEQQIFNGIPTSRHPSVGVLIFGEAAQDAYLQCSGTLIGCSYFLTAAHCFHDDTQGPKWNLDSSLYHVFLQNGGVRPVRDIKFPSEQYNSYTLFGDIAIVELGQVFEGVKPASIRTHQQAPVDIDGVIVGFGKTGFDQDDYGIKRQGVVRLEECPPDPEKKDKICWKVGPNGKDSNTCPGDSGGPLFISPNEQSSQVAAVTSYGKMEHCEVGDESYNTSTFFHSEWLQDNAESATPPITCDSLPFVGESDVLEYYEFGQLNEKDSFKTFSLEIPMKSNKLIVSLNAQDTIDSRTDFDLFVRYESTEQANANCALTGSGQFASCEIHAPSPGRWSITITREKGEGTYQIVSTIF